MTSVGTVISFPIPAFQNFPINAQFYIPNRFVISDVSLGFTTVVTTSIDHNYVIGQDVRLIIPPTFGCRQLNQVKGIVLSIPMTTQVEISINSLENVDPFKPSTYQTETAQIVAIGDINSGVTNANGLSPTGTFIPGSFINISPL